MADLFSPAKFDYEECRIKTAGTGDAIDPKHIAVDPASDNLITNDPALGLKVVADDLISAEEGNVAKKSQADGGILVKPADMISDEACNALEVDSAGKLRLRPEDLISDVNGGNPLGINPEDCKLFINPCLLPGPQNIVSNDEGNLIVRDPDDCSALLKYQNVVSEDAGNLIFPGTDGKLKVTMQDIVDKDYFGAGLVYVERQDGSHVLQVAACNGLTFNEGDKTDVRGNTYHAKWLSVDLDDNQNLLYFVSGDGCTECFEGCGQLSIEFSMNASGQWLRILDHNGNVYKRISLNNGLTASSDGGLTINTLDTLADTAPNNDLPISSKAVVPAINELRDWAQRTFSPIPHKSTDTTYGKGDADEYGHLKLSASHTSSLGVDDGTAATPSAVKKAYDDGTRKGTCSQFGQVKLTDSLTSTDGCADSVGLSAKAGKQLKDLIDQIVGPDDPDDPGTSDTRKAIYDFVVKNFQYQTVTASIGGTMYLITGEIHFPKVSNKRLDGILYSAVTGITDPGGEGSGSTWDVAYPAVPFFGKTSGNDTGYIVAIDAALLSTANRTALLNALNTAAGTDGMPMSELSHYRITNVGAGRISTNAYFLVAKNVALAASAWQLLEDGSGHGASFGRQGISSNPLTANEVVPYTKAYVDYEAK